MSFHFDHDAYNSIYSRDPAPDGPHGWIQWKGTNVCIDLHCECGHHGHVDADFFYSYECVGCGKKYAVAQHVKLIPLETPAEVAYFDSYEKDMHGDVMEDEDDDDEQPPEKSWPVESVEWTGGPPVFVPIHEPVKAPPVERTLPSGIVIVESE